MVFSPSWEKLPEKEFQKHKKENWENEQRVIKRSITRHFHNWIEKSFDEDGLVDIPDNLYCGSGVNFFTCGQDDSEWINNASAELESLGINKAILIVKMPAKPPRRTGVPTPVLMFMSSITT